MRLAPRIIFHTAPSHAHSQFPAVALRCHQLFRSFVGNSWSHPSDSRSVCWRHFRGPTESFRARQAPSCSFALGASTPEQRKPHIVVSSSAAFDVSTQPFNPSNSYINDSLWALILSIYLLYLFILKGLSNLGDGSFSAESSASDIIARVWTLRRDLSRRCCRCRPTHLNHNISPADSHIAY